MKKKKKDDPMRGPAATIMKFILSALCGLLMSAIALFLITFLFRRYFSVEFLLDGRWMHILWILPLLWGFLGIFFFERMLELAGEIYDGLARLLGH